MQIEVLYSDLCNLFGDTGNMRYFEKCVPDAEFIYTAFNDVPAFVNSEPDMIYMGPCTERNQERVIKKLMPYKEHLQKAIDRGTVMLFTGNAPEVLFEYIEKDDKSRTEGLGILKFHAVQSIYDRYNTIVLSKFGDMNVLGFKTQFTQTYGDNSDCYFTKVERGSGINKKSKLEGIHINNLFATSMVGPLLVINPYFTEYIMEKLGIENARCAFREEAVASYEAKLNEFRTCLSLTE